MFRSLALRPVDQVALTYLAVATVVLSAHLAGWRSIGGTLEHHLAASVLGAHGLVALCALTAPRLRRSGQPFFAALGDWYPLLTMLLLYTSVGLLNRGIGDGTHYDRLVMHWDQLLFGHQPAYEWPRNDPSSLLSWALHVCYLLYFPLLAIGPAVLWRRGQRDAACRAILATTTAFFACYLIFMLFPVAGPSYLWPTPDSAAADVWPARAARALFFRGDAWGSAFPSAHVATSVVATIFAIRGWRPLAWVTVPPTLGILFAVVYSQIHYGTDALAGTVLAAIVAVAMWNRGCTWRPSTQPAERGLY